MKIIKGGEYMSSLGEKIKEARKNKGLTTTQLAEMIDVSQGYISHLENNRKKNPSPEILQKIANVLEIPQTDLMIKAGYIDSDDLFVEMDKGTEKLQETHDQVKKLNEKLTSLSQAIFDLNKQNSKTSDEKIKNEIQNLLIEIRGIESILKNNHTLYFDSKEEVNKLKEIAEFLLKKQEKKSLLTDLTELLEEYNMYLELHLEDLFIPSYKLFLNGRELTSEEKEKAIQILKLSFDK